MESTIPTFAVGVYGAPLAELIGHISIEQTTYFANAYIILLSSIYFAMVVILPRTHICRIAAPASAIAMQEGFEFPFLRVQLTHLFMIHMSLNISYLCPALSFFHIGAMCGTVFYGALTAKLPRRIPLVIGQILGTAMLVVFSVWTSNIMAKSLGMHDRAFVADGNKGNRKVRPFVDPNLVKALTNEVGYWGAFPNDFQHCVLLIIFFGFCLSTVTATQMIFVDICSEEVKSRNAFFMYGLAAFYHGPICGALWSSQSFVWFDISTSFLVVIVFRFVWLTMILFSDESKGLERTVVVTGAPCYLKAMFYGMYLWPQGAGHITDMISFMLHNRQHLASTSAGYVSGVRRGAVRQMAYWIWAMWMQIMYCPTIVCMFLCMFFVPSPLNISLFMEMFNMWRTIEGYDGQEIYLSIYPAFVAQYMQVESIPWILCVSESMRNLGHWLAIARWPNMMLCGDPMNCWRSQYLYSHALFYNCGGDGGNIVYANWYLFTKSQKRQCCCPYRKLKPDAPEKCCPPCCLGPLVEETGGCPCPCCCSSCSA